MCPSSPDNTFYFEDNSLGFSDLERLRSIKDSNILYNNYRNRPHLASWQVEYNNAKDNETDCHHLVSAHLFPEKNC